MPGNLTNSLSIDASLKSLEAEPILAEVLRDLPGLIYTFNLKTQANEYTNREIGEELGYTAAEIREFGGQLMPKLCHPDDLERVTTHFESVSRLSDGDVAEVEYRFRHKDGHWVWMQSRDTVFSRDSQGRVNRFIGLAADITKQKTAEELARKETLLADAANDDLRAFSYSVSHEMKAPSNTIGMLLNEVIEQHGDAIPADAMYLLDLAVDRVKQMQSRIHDVLNMTMYLTRKESHGPANLAEILDRVLLDLAAEVSACSGDVHIETLPLVTACEGQMHTLFLNLVGNALKYRDPDAPPCIRIWDDSAPHEETVTIVVRDNGIGVPDASRDKVFEMFKRLHLQSEYEGNGLGLAICRRIVSDHNGEIFVRNAPDKGSDFVVRLPR